ncbi:GMC family oxidoreductase [Sphingosinicella microcystinivorans]|uniref:Choline dehydrogenase n=1 Tax=Sphingosinicella microcystinivorans TaxID=335406 RepID=A0AAD1G162_SPHMI|nr:GMC family oxidoreductase N-terminal domain-containing protein [Sphingosinicella microcystinivorans]RKS91372.1 choline dehydrogenase [Sphingosinicella microcystinivorans]BBE34345.1 choline dehydrogenase [Sphingosinicella microcystinivorans]
MIDPKIEAAQCLVDAAASGRLGRRGFMAALTGTFAGIVSVSAAETALAAGSVQHENRANGKRSFDYVVVGAGAAGCIIAARLARAGFDVALLEAGGDDEAAGAQVDDPSIWFTNIGGPLDWSYPSLPSPHLNGRSIPIGAGRVLGGGTSVNASLWVHGFQDDFNGWAEAGCTGWSAAEVMPIYRALENWAGPPSEWRGTDGAMDVCLPKTPHPTAVAWIEASREMGLPVLDDMNAPMREGAGYTNLSIRPDGSRASASRAYLRPALGLPNLTLLLASTATRLLFNGTRCTGVEIADAGGARQSFTASREVIVTAGGVGSAKLLLLSGIGPSKDLRKLGIGMVADLPGVGENFQDHPLLEGVILKYRGEMPSLAKGSDAVEATSFIRSALGGVPDLQPVLIQLPIATPALVAKYGEPPEQGFTIAPGLVRPTGRGWVKLSSTNFRDMPLLDCGFLSTDADMDATIRCIEFCLEFGQQKAFREISEGEAIPGRPLNRADIADFARDSATSYYHPVGTCKMGTDDMAVVDPTLRVCGIEGLRVCDSAVMPTITAGNTNAPAQLIGEKAARLILGEAA